jgi:hypothetical protein
MQLLRCSRSAFATRVALTTIVLCWLPIAVSHAQQTPRAATFYIGRISSTNAWHDLFTSPTQVEFVDAYLAVAALSREFARQREGDVTWEVEAQAGYNFGDQSHWEFNGAFGPRWHAFPWSGSVKTSAAFLFGLSMATEVPEVEVELEGDSEKLLIYWCMELVAGPPRGNWSVSLRLHHRSGGFGLFADDGGMNALALGARIGF